MLCALYRNVKYELRPKLKEERGWGGGYSDTTLYPGRPDIIYLFGNFGNWENSLSWHSRSIKYVTRQFSDRAPVSFSRTNILEQKFQTLRIAPWCCWNQYWIFNFLSKANIQVFSQRNNWFVFISINIPGFSFHSNKQKLLQFAAPTGDRSGASHFCLETCRVEKTRDKVRSLWWNCYHKLTETLNSQWSKQRTSGRRLEPGPRTGQG